MSEHAEQTGYAAIAAHYRRLISDGVLKPGDLMPSMRDVCTEFGVAITTANRAFRLLKDDGWTDPRPGAGTLVAYRPFVVSTGSARLDRLQRTGQEYAPHETSTDHVAMTRSCHDVDCCRMLDIDPGDEIVIRRRVFRRAGKPTVVALSMINTRGLAAVPELLTQGQLKPFWQETYRERTGREITRAPERRFARHASTDELNALEVDVPPHVAVPVLVLHTLFSDEDGPIELWEDVHAPGEVQIADK